MKYKRLQEELKSMKNLMNNTQWRQRLRLSLIIGGAAFCLSGSIQAQVVSPPTEELIVDEFSESSNQVENQLAAVSTILSNNQIEISSVGTIIGRLSTVYPSGEFDTHSYTYRLEEDAERRFAINDNDELVIISNSLGLGHYGIAIRSTNENGQSVVNNLTIQVVSANGTAVQFLTEELIVDEFSESSETMIPQKMWDEFGNSFTFMVPFSGQAITVPVMHTGDNKGVISVNYRVIADSATAQEVSFAAPEQITDEFGNTTTIGTLTWLDGDDTNKNIELFIANNQVSETEKMFWITLFDLTNRVQLGNPVVIQVVIKNARESVDEDINDGTDDSDIFGDTFEDDLWGLEEGTNDTTDDASESVNENINDGADDSDILGDTFEDDLWGLEEGTNDTTDDSDISRGGFEDDLFSLDDESGDTTSPNSQQHWIKSDGEVVISDEVSAHISAKITKIQNNAGLMDDESLNGVLMAQDDEARIQFRVTVDPEHIGKAGSFHVVFSHLQQGLYIYDGITWQTWDGLLPNLVMSAQTFSVLPSVLEFTLPWDRKSVPGDQRGQFDFYAGYQINDENRLVYSPEPLTHLWYPNSKGISAADTAIPLSAYLIGHLRTSSDSQTFKNGSVLKSTDVVTVEHTMVMDVTHVGESAEIVSFLIQEQAGKHFAFFMEQPSVLSVLVNEESLDWNTWDGDLGSLIGVKTYSSLPATLKFQTQIDLNQLPQQSGKFTVYAGYRLKNELTVLGDNALTFTVYDSIADKISVASPSRSGGDVEACGFATLDADSNVNVPCLIEEGSDEKQYYGLRLLFNPNLPSLGWRFDGEYEPITCEVVDEEICAIVSEDRQLKIPYLADAESDVVYNAYLDFATNGADPFTWQWLYRRSQVISK
jgi:hypothetical protein